MPTGDVMGPSRDSPVEAVIRQMRPRTLFTVPVGARFEVDNLAPDAVELLFGGSKTRTVIRWTCLEGIPAFLHEKGWVEIGATHSVTVKPGTLEAYLRTCLRRRALVHGSSLSASDRRGPGYRDGRRRMIST